MGCGHRRKVWFIIAIFRFSWAPCWAPSSMTYFKALRHILLSCLFVSLGYMFDRLWIHAKFLFYGLLFRTFML